MIKLVDLKDEYNKIKDEIDEAIQEVLNNTSFILGDPVKKFEEELADFCKCKYAIGVASGTAALFLALKAHGIKEGDEVITVPNSFIATAEAIIHCGATPVFVDVNKDNMLIDVKKIEEKITDKTKAIVPVHLFGQHCDMSRITQIAKENNLFIIEDAAQAINEIMPMSDTACFSFFPAKNLGCYGDGGAVITNDEHIAKEIYKLRNHGRDSKYESSIIGYGERLDALQAAILSVKLKHLKKWTAQRYFNAAQYDKILKHSDIDLLPNHFIYHLYVIITHRRDELKKYLKDLDIESGIHYHIPLHLQKWLEYLGKKKRDFKDDSR